MENNTILELTFIINKCTEFIQDITANNSEVNNTTISSLTKIKNQLKEIHENSFINLPF